MKPEDETPAVAPPFERGVGRLVPERGIAGELQAALARQATGEPMTEGELWSFLRSVMCQGADIRTDYDMGVHKGYEAYSARLDAAAAERAEQLWARLKTPNVRANRPSGAATGVAMTDKVAGPDGSVLSEGLGPNAQTVERWYCVSREGMATLCVDEEDARANAAHCDQAWRAGSPHRAVRLVDAPRWVPVSEALPPEHVTCAVRMQGDYIATAWAAYWHGARTDFGRWVFPHDSDEDCADKITHWLALPTVAGLGA